MNSKSKLKPKNKQTKYISHNNFIKYIKTSSRMVQIFLCASINETAAGLCAIKVCNQSNLPYQTKA